MNEVQRFVSTNAMNKKYFWYGIPVLMLFILLTIIFYNYKSSFTLENIKSGINADLLVYLLVGICAQLVDNTLGMGYGATSTSFLLSVGVPPALSSTGVHVAEMFTTGASAIAHHRFGNINKKLVLSLLVPGVIGSILGAYLLSDVIDGDVIKPFIAIYMMILAILIIRKGLKTVIEKKKVKNLGPLALFGGFMDAIGGGGWGPIVTSRLIGKGRDPRYTIGSVNTAEFAVAFASGITFMLFGGIKGWQIIAGLIIGGVVAAPLGAYLINKIPRKQVTILVGCILIFLSLRTLIKAYF